MLNTAAGNLGPRNGTHFIDGCVSHINMLVCVRQKGASGAKIRRTGHSFRIMDRAAQAAAEGAERRTCENEPKYFVENPGSACFLP